MRISRLRILVLLGLAVGAVMTVAAVAANVHYKSKAGATFTDNGLTLSASGALTGLGNGDIVVTLTSGGQASAECINPGTGEHRPAGQNPAPGTFGGAQEIPAGSVKNGNVTFNVSTSPPQSPIPGAPDCPNSRWIENITDVSFSGFTATIIVYQGIGCSTTNFSACTEVFRDTQTVP
jgi:hypothetical protein